MKRKKIIIFHGPTSIGGLGGYLANYERQAGYQSDFYTYRDRTPQQNHHVNLELKDYNLLVRPLIVFFFFLFCLLKYDIFHFYFGRTFLPLNLDLPILRLFGKKMIMTYCGSDVRLINDVEKVRNPYYKLLKVELDHPFFDIPKKITMFWQNLWISKFFAIRSLYLYVKTIIPAKKIINDIWINNLIDLDEFHPTFQTNPIPTVVHAPTSPRIKGTEFVEKIISSLEQEGHRFTYLRLEKLSFDESKEILRHKADIVLDQFLVGDFGCLAVESMSYGKPVCCFLGDNVIRDYPDCPIVNCTIDNLKEKLIWLITHPDERIEIGKQGRAFVEKYCDHKKLMQELIKIYESLINGTD